MSQPVNKVSATSVDFPQTCCQAAMARRDITPPVGIYHRMWGAATHDRSVGVHRPLTATALALRGNSTPSGAEATLQVLVSIDHCLLWTEQMEALRANVIRATLVPDEALQITFTHTHAAGLMDPQRADLPGGDLIAPYLELLSERISEAVLEAIETLQIVRIVYGTGRCGLARHRDFWDEKNQLFSCGFNPDGPTDDTLLVARLTNDDQQTIGTVVNYACHPTTLAWDNQLISPDYVGAMRELVEAETGAPCLFLQGASGDLGPREGFVGDTTVADRNGRELGYAALAALEALPCPATRYEYSGPVVSGATIGTWRHVPLSADQLLQKQRCRIRRFKIELPFRDDLPTRQATEESMARWTTDEAAAHQRGDEPAARDARAQAERMTRQLARLRALPPGKTVSLTGSLAQWGDAYWVAVAAEHYSLLQRSLRERFAECPIIVTTMTNGWQPGYVPEAGTFGRGIYQETVALVAPGSLERVIDEIGQLIDQWR